MTTEPIEMTNDNNQGDRLLYDQPLKAAVQELIKYGVLEASYKPNLYRHCVQRHEEIAQILSPLDFKMQIDDVRGLVFLLVAKDENTNNADLESQEVTEGLTGMKSSAGMEKPTELEHSDDWQHPLVRRQRMNLEQSLMVAILRQHFVAHELDAGVGDTRAIVHLDELLPQLNQFLGATGSEAKEDKRLRLLLEQLKGYGLVSEIDDNEKITIKPLIAHVANPENLQNLIAALKKHLKSQQKEK
jgi:hypothetical protein